MPRPTRLAKVLRMTPPTPTSAPEPTRPGTPESVKAALATPLTTTTGPTSEPTYPLAHAARLVETHDVTAPVAGRHIDAVIDQCRAAAEAWLDAQGLGASISVISRSDGTAGVTFDVHVGHGDIHPDQRLPGALDSWRWSARRDHWRGVLGGALARRTARIKARDGLASVTSLHGAGYPASDGPRVGAKVQAAMGVGVDGCSCHLGGPFRDICPVHYRPGGNT